MADASDSDSEDWGFESLQAGHAGEKLSFLRLILCLPVFPPFVKENCIFMISAWSDRSCERRGTEMQKQTFAYIFVMIHIFVIY